jgi:hypothetical protein
MFDEVVSVRIEGDCRSIQRRPTPPLSGLSRFNSVQGSGILLASASGMHARTLFRSHLCSELVSVARLSDRLSAQDLDGNLEEIGEWSALILTQDAVPRGTKVRVKGKAHELNGFVRSCTFDRLLGFFIDIGLNAESRWSANWYAPEHLFELCPSMRYFTESAPKVPEKVFLAKVAHS